MEDEYPYKSKAQRQSARELAKIRSSITKTAERITLLVENEIDGLNGKLELTASSLTAEINNTAQGLRGELQLTASSLSGRISTAEGNIGSLQLTATSHQPEFFHPKRPGQHLPDRPAGGQHRLERGWQQHHPRQCSHKGVDNQSEIDKG